MGILAWGRQARLCETLASTLDAGLPPHSALTLAGAAAGGEVGRRAKAAAAAVLTGTPLSKALAERGEEALLCAVAAAGESSGRLPAMLRQLAAAYGLRARLRDEALGRLVYPVVLIHATLTIPTLPFIVSGALPAIAALAGPALLWLAVGIAVAATRAGHRAGLLGRLALRPPLAALCRPALVADAAAVLHAALAAGLLVPDALELAAGACANRELATRLRGAAAEVRQKRLADLTAALAACGVAGDELELVRAGEQSGRLEEGLLHVRTLAAERFALRLTWTVKVVNGTIYAIALITAAAAVLGMASQVYGPVQELQRELGE